MSWFKKKGKYWYFQRREGGREVQYYIGDDEAVIRKLRPNQKKRIQTTGRKPPTSQKLRTRS